MEFQMIHGTRAVPFLLEEEAFPGVLKVAEKVRNDIRLVTGKLPKQETLCYDSKKKITKPFGKILVATVGYSPLLTVYEEEGLINLKEVRGKREVFSLQVVGEGNKAVLVIAGSDKRGTIYGLFHLSECIGVSPFVYFADAAPLKQKEPVLTEACLVTSKEPSVKYRGFFINDEWPSFGGWTTEKFGGFTAEMYDKVFELLLRLKGNYLWPAMWSSSFPLDGPGLLSAELADLYGVVMGTSHHEPCLRASEEWDKVKGARTPYGTEWNYATNREGLLRYWEEGLVRSGKFENIITIGMRGERDSSMLGPNATLKENIDLLKDIITEQRKLIAKYVEDDKKKVPLMLALYKEVEAYFYGDETTPGLKDWEGLDGVTLMLCEDNFGNMRTLPTEELREHHGGFGMYYHFDYHGGPVSYEWVNSTPIKKVWEQMSEAYDYGIRDIWIVNVGDLKPQEYPLTFFLKLAYDFDSYGTANKEAAEQFREKFVADTFGGYFNSKEQEEISYLLEEYTRLNGIRRPEVNNADVFHPVNYGEAARIYRRAKKLKETAEALLRECKPEIRDAFFELAAFPAIASANIFIMQLSATLNHYYANHGMTVANRFAENIGKAIKLDSELQKEYHSIADGKWNFMMSSAHIGFRSWNEEGCVYPVSYQVTGVKGKRAGVRVNGEERVLLSGTSVVKVKRAGGDILLELLNGGTEPVSYSLKTEGSCSTTSTTGTYQDIETVTVHVTGGETGPAGKLHIVAGRQTFDIAFQRVAPVLCRLKKESFSENLVKQVQGDGEYVVFEADEFTEKKDLPELSYCVLKGYGRTKASVKAYPATRSVSFGEAKRHETAELSYTLEAAKDGAYIVTLYVSPTNPLYPGDSQELALSVNHGEVQIFSTLPDGFLAGNCYNREWNQNVLDNIRVIEREVALCKGENTLSVGAVSAGVILQKIVVTQKDTPLKKSYLGPFGE